MVNEFELLGISLPIHTEQVVFGQVVFLFKNVFSVNKIRSLARSQGFVIVFISTRSSDSHVRNPLYIGFELVDVPLSEAIVSPYVKGLELLVALQTNVEVGQKVSLKTCVCQVNDLLGLIFVRSVSDVDDIVIPFYQVHDENT